MFRANDYHRQSNFFTYSVALTAELQQELEETPEYAFYRLVFSRIDEQPFAALYSGEKSRPNAPVNTLVGAMILHQYHNWSVVELLGAIRFDLRVRQALGLNDWHAAPFCEATYFNFQKALYGHYLKTGVNLLEGVFDHLTKQQLKALKLKTDIQRADSFFAASNICNYSRLQLLVEVLFRLHRQLSEADRQVYAEHFAPYVKYASSGQYIYRQKQGDAAERMRAIGQVYHTLHQALASGYGETEIFKIFARVYSEHFTVAEQKVELIPAENLSGAVLQSPDDPDAGYRQKGEAESQGQVAHVAETAHPDNPLQLITDVAVAINTTDDSVILNGRLDTMTAKTPDLNELHTDGAYGGKANDVKMAEAGIVHVQTAIKGRAAVVALKIDAAKPLPTPETEAASNAEPTPAYRVSCPVQEVAAQPTPTRFKAVFDPQICRACPLAAVCSLKPEKRSPVYYFDREDFLRGQRHRALETLPLERRTLRANVEATVREFDRRMTDGKLKVRGQFAAARFAFGVAIGINFGRIFRYQRDMAAEARKSGTDSCAQNG
jgi:hypothetical protein